MLIKNLLTKWEAEEENHHLSIKTEQTKILINQKKVIRENKQKI